LSPILYSFDFFRSDWLLKIILRRVVRTSTLSELCEIVQESHEFAFLGFVGPVFACNSPFQTIRNRFFVSALCYPLVDYLALNAIGYQLEEIGEAKPNHFAAKNHFCLQVPSPYCSRDRLGDVQKRQLCPASSELTPCSGR
jgi:hypothetical protein